MTKSKIICFFIFYVVLNITISISVSFFVHFTFNLINPSYQEMQSIIEIVRSINLTVIFLSFFYCILKVIKAIRS